MEEQCQQTSTTMANSGQTIGKRIKNKNKKKKLLLFFKYLCWKNVFFKRPDYKYLRFCRGPSLAFVANISYFIFLVL